MRTRAELNRVVGILRVWQARDDLAVTPGSREGREVERMIAAVDAAADSGADPDLRWD